MHLSNWFCYRLQKWTDLLEILLLILVIFLCLYTIKKEVTHVINTQVIDQDDPACDKVEDIIDTNPLARASIDESQLPAPNQEILVD